MRIAVIFAGLSLPALALACPGAKTEMAAASAPQAEVQLAKADAADCAKKAEFIGGNCSYSTNMMAQKVMEQGTSFTYTGSMDKSENKLESHVAAPFTIKGDIHVIANGVLDTLSAVDARLAMDGKLLEVDGTKYFLLVDAAPANS
ncbi:MAG: hypothetical protein ACI8PZ_000389 [Myxococcota bacterium]|jgi:hypothetical protein